MGCAQWFVCVCIDVNKVMFMVILVICMCDGCIEIYMVVLALMSNLDVIHLCQPHDDAG